MSHNFKKQKVKFAAVIYNSPHLVIEEIWPSPDFDLTIYIQAFPTLLQSVASGKDLDKPQRIKASLPASFGLMSMYTVIKSREVGNTIW